MYLPINYFFDHLKMTLTVSEFIDKDKLKQYKLPTIIENYRHFNNLLFLCFEIYTIVSFHLNEMFIIFSFTYYHGLSFSTVSFSSCILSFFELFTFTSSCFIHLIYKLTIGHVQYEMYSSLFVFCFSLTSLKTIEYIVYNSLKQTNSNYILGSRYTKYF